MIPTVIKAIAGGVLLGIVVVVLFLVRDVLKKMSGSALILLGGLFTLFAGERVLGGGDWRMPVSGVGLAVIAIAIGLRAFAWSRSTGQRRSAHQQALMFTGFVLGGLALYALSLETVVTALGLTEDGALRWHGALASLAPMLVVIGLGPIFLLDRALSLHPVQLPIGAARRAVSSGVSGALAVALVFPVNYLAATHEKTWDVAYFRTTRPGDATQSLVKTVSAPVKATLFFPPGNDVGREIEPYFEGLAAASGGQLTFEMVDQPVVPKLAEELKIRENGFIALTQGDNTERFKLGTDLDKVKRDLKKLDQTVYQHLVKLTRGERTIYMLSGHGEASTREKDDPLRKLNSYKGVLETENYKIKQFGPTEGSASGVPEDAAAVIIAAPSTALLPEEVAVLEKYYDEGGHLLILAEPAGASPFAPQVDEGGAATLDQLLAHLGVKVGGTILANKAAFIPQNHGAADRVLTVTNRFGTHESVKTLSRNSTQVGLIIPTVQSVEKGDAGENNVVTLVRSMPETWADVDGDREMGPNEPGKVFDLAVAVTRGDDPEKQGRAILIGDVNVFSDVMLQVSQGNKVFATESIRWLTGDDKVEGGTENEEDVKIQHSNEEDQLWFWLSTFLVPVVIAGVGVVAVQLRRRNA